MKRLLGYYPPARVWRRGGAQVRVGGRDRARGDACMTLRPVWNNLKDGIQKNGRGQEAENASDSMKFTPLL